MGWASVAGMYSITAPTPEQGESGLSFCAPYAEDSQSRQATTCRCKGHCNPNKLGRWRKGIRFGLKSRWPRGLVGSTPTRPIFL